MFTVPKQIMPLFRLFEQEFSTRTWYYVPILVIGAILAPGKRTITAMQKVVGLGDEEQFQAYHRVLNRAVWSPLAIAHILLQELLRAFNIGQTIILVLDETLERRRGERIKMIGCFRDATRSSKSNKVKSYGLRWMCMTLVTPVSWSLRAWALPFLTVLAPNEKANEKAGRRHKTSIRLARQMICQTRRWLPKNKMVVIVDGGLAELDAGLRCQSFANPVTYLTVLQYNARLFDLPPIKTGKTRGRPQLVGKRFPLLNQLTENPETVWQTTTVKGYGGKPLTVSYVSEVCLWYTKGKQPLRGRTVWVKGNGSSLKASVLFATDPDATPEQILEWYVMRWSIEVTFEETRAHLGFNTQRHWNDLAISRFTPSILALFSFVCLLAQRLIEEGEVPVQSYAWYKKKHATFSDILAFVRLHLWTHTEFLIARPNTPSANIPPELIHLWLRLLPYAS